jgi:hypothetical protein
VISAVAISQGGVAFRHGGFVCNGMANTIVPLVLGTFGYALTSKLIVFVVSLKPLPRIVTRVATGPESGCTEVIAGADEGATLLPAHPESATPTKHART